MNIVSKLKKLYNQVRGLFPSRVPVGLTEFNTWKDRIIANYSPPGDERSIKFVLSSLLMRLDPSEAYKSDFYFANSLVRSAASQVAVYVQEEIKQAQRAEFEAQQAAALALSKETSPDGQATNPT